MMWSNPEESHRQSSMPNALRAFEYGCWLFGGLLVSWVMATLWSAHTYQKVQSEHLADLGRSSIRSRGLSTGDFFGKISIPRLHLSAVIAEGVDDATLRHAVGHFPESSIPEKEGTVALAGHRDTFFRALAHIRLHDQIELDTPYGVYRYEVIRTEVVTPDHTEVVRSSPQSDLTLVTCYPFRYVGHAPDRFIVQALRSP
jgi:sortase A